MVCYYCGHETAVTNSRPQKRANRVWRRRKCLQCDNVVSTLEAVDYPSSISYKNSSGALEPFQRDYVFISIYDSLKHRKTALTDATALTDTLLARLPTVMLDATVARHDLITLVTGVLNKFDTVAGVQYAAYHPL